ncbi:hypothetical protein [Micromonospora sp. NPDC048839]|uniref:hypothetical protein n=1 Tax=Micromonospora sp. NPDC048839 TaxID=3155641 RepID=UPI0034012501
MPATEIRGDRVELVAWHDGVHVYSAGDERALAQRATALANWGEDVGMVLTPDHWDRAALMLPAGMQIHDHRDA